MTNLIASIVVSVVTNTVEEFPHHWEPMAPLPQDIHRVGDYGAIEVDAIFRARLVPDANPTVKTNRTVCKEITRLRFDWNGPREITTERVLWETNVIMRLEWTKK